MAANAMAVPPVAGNPGFWTRFQRLAEDRVKEVNAIAGEPLWEVVSAGPGREFTIRSTRCAADFLHCLIDSESGVLACKPGSAISSGPLKFRLVGGMLHGFGRQRGVYADYDALTLILDKLAWIEDDRK